MSTSLRPVRSPLMLESILGVLVLTTAHAVEIPPAPGGSEVSDAEVTLRGPIHEAFLSRTQLDARDGVIVPKRPPQAIEEIPPNTRPVGDNVGWIPGYWGWDHAEEDFLWGSGVWRNYPPTQRWVPGCWIQADNDYRWRPDSGRKVETGGSGYPTTTSSRPEALSTSQRIGTILWTSEASCSPPCD